MIKVNSSIYTSADKRVIGWLLAAAPRQRGGARRGGPEGATSAKTFTCHLRAWCALADQ